MILLRTTEDNGSCFIRTDQLDGETDWKLRLAVPSLQRLPADDSLIQVRGEIYGRWSISTPLYAYTDDSIADAPHKDIHSFIGTFTHVDEETGIEQREPLSVENTLWTNTVLASGSAIGFVIYTGKDTRAVMNTNHPKTKVGLLDTEINRLAKVGIIWWSKRLCIDASCIIFRFSLLSRWHFQ